MYQFLWYFFIFAFLGWCVEVAFEAVLHGKFINRGLLNGPVCPIYGFGVVLVYYLLRPLSDSFMMLFVGSVLLTSALEWLTGFVLEKVFHQRWWDYSHRRFNLNGYICLPFSLAWGAACVFVINFLIPLANIFIGLLPRTAGIVLLSAFGALLLADCVMTVVTIVGLNNKLRRLNRISTALKQNSDSIGQFVSKETLELKAKYDALLERQSGFRRRLLAAFPNLRSVKYEEQLNDLKAFVGTLRTGSRQLVEENAKKHAQMMVDTYEYNLPCDAKRPFAYGICFSKLFWLFMIGSFIGFLVETVWCLLTTHHFELRVGVVFGPFIPVYGFGAVLITLCLYRFYRARDLKLFLISMVIGAAFEYLCSVFQEVAFGTVSWEYSHTALNLGGRTNLMYAFCWGLLGLLWIKDLYPRVSKWIEKIPVKTGSVLTAVLCIFMALDLFISSAAVSRQTERRNGIPPANRFDRFMDETFTDEVLKVIYPNMIYVDTLKEHME